MQRPAGSRRVLVIFHEDVVGGATRSVLRAIPHLAERGWEFAFHVAEPSEVADELRAEGYKVTGAERQVGFSVKWLRDDGDAARKLRTMPAWFASVAGAIREHRPALVHCNSLYTLADGVVARGLRTPVLLHVHEMLPEGWKGQAARRVAAAAGMEVAAVSRSSAERFAGPGGALPRVVYESTTLPPAITERRNGEPFTVGSVGWVCPRKGTDLFVEAAARVRERDPSIRFELVGGNPPSVHKPWGDRVLARAAEVGVQHTERDDVFQRLQGWDALVACSRFDPFPLVVLEAMASGRPVVGSRVDGIAEQVTPDTGLLAEPEDAASLAERILELARRAPDERAALGAAGRRRVEAHFTPVPQADALEQAYLAALGGR